MLIILFLVLPTNPKPAQITIFVPKILLPKRLMYNNFKSILSTFIENLTWGFELRNFLKSHLCRVSHNSTDCFSCLITVYFSVVFWSIIESLKNILGCFHLLFQKKLSALKSHMTCYNLNFNLCQIIAEIAEIDILY